MDETSYVYVSLIETTPQQLWRALTDSRYIARYFDNTGPRSDWQVGSTVEWQMTAGGGYHDWGQKVLESIPQRRLSYTWYGYKPEMANVIPGRTADNVAQQWREPISTVTFDMEPAGSNRTKLTFMHGGFVKGSPLLAGVSQGWPEILSRLKTLLEDESAGRFEPGK